MAEDELDDALLVPAPDERRWLAKELAALVRAHGPAPLLVHPILLADATHFPDPWVGGEASMRRLARRLLRYAGLPDARVAVTIHDDGPGGPATAAGSVAPVWLESIKDGVLHFSAAASALKQPLVFVPATARAVAEAWRRHHGLAVTDDASSQRLVDVTAVYLGFGRLTVDAAIRHHAGATLGLAGSRSRTRLGMLSPQAVAWLLAMGVCARDLSDAARKQIAKSLQPNPAAFFRAAAARLSGVDRSMIDALGLPAREQWPARLDIDALTAPLPDDDEDAAVEDGDPTRHDDRGVVGINTGRPVFRVARSKAMRLAKLLALPVVTLGMVAARMQGGALEIPMWQLGLGAAVLGLLGLGIGRFLPDSRCSEPKCGAELSEDAKVCPRCGGTVAGVIAHPRERLAAEEALRNDPG